ncbi:PREDICTED: LOC109804371 [Prunus dulcis]|uniref:PREDICTED: LOC109804371 n=1 Tax=Prunus dulcis TaxID=3755 RepID=A0A5E4E5H1_PRUDU|nr:PREDICTED: LOC109804371 [Prunus dulcis]
MESHVQSGKKRSWTDEKHLQFLNSMEASFVRAMFERKDHRLLRLDRYLPDTSDSTLDLKTLNKTKKKGGRMDGGADKRLRRFSSQPFNASQDQVGNSHGNE